MPTPNTKINIPKPLYELIQEQAGHKEQSVPAYLWDLVRTDRNQSHGVPKAPLGYEVRLVEDTDGIDGIGPYLCIGGDSVGVVALTLENARAFARGASQMTVKSEDARKYTGVTSFGAMPDLVDVMKQGAGFRLSITHGVGERQERRSQAISKGGLEDLIAVIHDACNRGDSARTLAGKRKRTQDAGSFS